MVGGRTGGDLTAVSECVLSGCEQHNAEPEAVDLLMEVGREGEKGIGESVG